EGGDPAHRREMLADLFGCRLDPEAVDLAQRHPELEPVDRVEAEPLPEQRLVAVDILRLQVFEIERGDDQSLDIKLQVAHRCLDARRVSKCAASRRAAKAREAPRRNGAVFTRSSKTTRKAAGRSGISYQGSPFVRVSGSQLMHAICRSAGTSSAIFAKPRCSHSGRPG